MEDFIERMIEMDLSIQDKNISQSSCVYELSDEVLERIKSNDHKLTSLKLLGSSTTNTHHESELLSLLRSRELCEKAGALIGSNTHLNELYIDTEDDIDRGLEENFDKFLMGVANNRSLTKLNLGYVSDGPNVIKVLKPLFENCALTTISFENCTSTQTWYLSSFLSKKNNNERGTLKHLSLDGTRGDNPIDDYDAAILITTLGMYHCIETLTLNWTTINEKSSNALSNMLSNPNCTLKELTLEYNEFDDEQVSTFAEGILGNNKLGMMNLRGSNAITSDGWKRFFNILRPATLGALHTLCLDKNNIDDEVVTIFMEVFANNNILKELDLGNSTSITTVGWQALASLFLNPNSAIEKISIANARSSFDDDAVIAWTNALSQSKNATLKEMWFSPRGITSRGWLSLENLVCNKTSVDTLYDSNHALSYMYGEGEFELCEGVPTTMDAYHEFQLSCRIAFCSRRQIAKNARQSTDEQSGLPDRIQNLLKKMVNKIDRPETRHEKALQKIVHFYFRSGEANMKEILDMDLNVMVHVIAMLGCFSKDGHHTNALLGHGEHTLLYQIMRSVPSLFDVSSSKRKNRKVESK